MNTADATAASQLPAPIGEYLAAHHARAVDVAVGYYTDDATVIDEGNTYRGREEIGAWLGSAAGVYTFTTELTGTRRIDDEHYVAMHHLEGNFPGGVADLQFKFTLRDGLISQLTIEP